MVYFTAAAAFAFALSLAILYSKPEPLMGDAIALARSCFVFRGINYRPRRALCRVTWLS